MPVTKQSVTFTFQDPSGSPIAGGTVTARLQFDISAATAGGPQVSAGITDSTVLDSNGSATLMLWPNDVTFPANSIYFIKCFTALGLLAWSGELTVTS